MGYFSGESWVDCVIPLIILYGGNEPQNLSSETNKEHCILPDQVLSFLCSLLFLFSTLFLMACLCEAMTTNVLISYLKSLVVQQSM